MYWVGLSLKDWGFEHENQLPTLLQCWDKLESPWPKRKARDRNKLSPAGIALVGLFAVHACMIAAVSLGLQLTHAEQDAWMCGVLVPMVVAWLVEVIEVLTRTY
jgi:hypothetical protein